MVLCSMKDPIRSIIWLVYDSKTSRGVLLSNMCEGEYSPMPLFRNEDYGLMDKKDRGDKVRDERRKKMNYIPWSTTYILSYILML